MRSTIGAAAVALALLAGCGGGDSDTALTPGDSSAPTTSSTPDASSSPTAPKTSTSRSTAKPSKSPRPTETPFDYSKLPPNPVFQTHPTAYPASQLSPELTGDTYLSCAAAEFPYERILKPRLASDLDPAVQKVFKQYVEDDNLAKWTVVTDEDNYVMIVEQQDPELAQPFDYWEAFLSKGKNGKERWQIGNDDEPGYHCTIYRVLPDLESSDWYLVATPKPGDTSIRISVFSIACGNKGAPATDRMRVPILEVTKDAIRVAVGNTPTPDTKAYCAEDTSRTIYELKLPEAVGNRAIINIGQYPEVKQETR